MEKAYDRIKWGFSRLFNLNCFSFISSVLLIVFSTQYFSLMVNGSLKSYFSSSRELYQEDPLSPNLLIVFLIFLLQMKLVFLMALGELLK